MVFISLQDLIVTFAIYLMVSQQIFCEEYEDRELKTILNDYSIKLNTNNAQLIYMVKESQVEVRVSNENTIIIEYNNGKMISKLIDRYLKTHHFCRYNRNIKELAVFYLEEVRNKIVLKNMELFLDNIKDEQEQYQFSYAEVKKEDKYTYPFLSEIPNPNFQNKIKCLQMIEKINFSYTNLDKTLQRNQITIKEFISKCTFKRINYFFSLNPSIEQHINQLNQECFECESKIGMFYDEDYERCSNCMKDCSICKNKLLCLQCKEDHYFIDNNCERISNKFIKSLYQSYLPICQDECSCNQLENIQCFFCFKNCIYFRNEIWKLKQQNNGLIKHGQIERFLQQCSPNCSNCTTYSKCNSCNSGYFLQNIDNMGNNTCNQCGSQCDKCNNASSCQLCLSPFYAYQGVCIECNANCSTCSSTTVCITCNSSYFLFSGTCMQCSAHCQTCSNARTCTSCSSRYYLSQGTCIQCTPNCSVCSGPNNTCTTCVSPYYLYQGACILCNSNCQACSSTAVCSTCVTPYYLYQGTCIQCSAHCQACSSTTHCTTCVTPYYLYQGTCIQCSANCSECSSPTTCTSCASPYYLYQGTCVLCNSNCSACSSTTICTTCVIPFYLYVGQCIRCSSNCQACSSLTMCITCVRPFYLYQGTCIQCSSNCQACSSNTMCTTCVSPYYLYQGACILCNSNCQACSSTTICTTCVTPYYLYQGTCMQCSAHCQACSSTTHCTTCVTPYYLYQGICIKCNLNCLTCSSPTICTTCVSPHYLYQGACILCNSNCQACSSITICTTCVIPFYLYQGQCIQCSSNCQACSSPTMCTICVSSFYLYKGTCIKCSSNCQACLSTTICTTCVSPYYLNQGTCILCNSNCSACSSPIICTACVRPYFLYKGNCIFCHSNCSACSSTTVCTTCITPYYLYQGNCIQCSTNCLTCSSTSVCLTCETPYYLYKDPVTNNNYCILCSNNCKTCSSTTTCLSCHTNYYLNTFGQQVICSQCASQCIGCSLESNKNCENCLSSYYQSSDTSCLPCSNSTISPSIVSVLEKRCRDSQTVCLFNQSSGQYENTLICNQCSSEYSLVDNTCITSCSDIGQNFIYDQTMNSCNCSPQNPYLLITSFNQKVCSNSVLPGFYCDNSGHKCFQCQTNCSICSNLKNCSMCSNNYYLWENQCISSCSDQLNLKIDSDNQKCQCKDSYIYQESMKQCLVILKVLSLSYSLDKEFNIITIFLSRAPLVSELSNLNISFDPPRLTNVQDYTIQSNNIVDDKIIYKVTVPINTKIGIIDFSINSQSVAFKVLNTMLLTQSCIKNQQTESAASTMNSSGSSLTQSKGFVGIMISQLKNIQLLCSFSNFVQLYGSLVLFYGQQPSAVFIGQIFGCSFIFKNIPSYQVIMDNSLQSGALTTQQFIFKKLGLTTYLYQDFILPHLFINLAVIINLFCFLVRWRFNGKQYSMTVVNYLVNTLYSLQQGFITSSLFSIFNSLKYGESQTAAIYQLIIHAIFLIQMSIYSLKRKSSYIEINLPNMVLNLNPKMKGWKSYLILSFLKKYICILLIIQLNNPFLVSILISIIFILFSAYLMYFRFFSHRIFVIIKPIQELLIGMSFIMLAICIQKHNSNLDNQTISDNELLIENKLSFTVMIMFTLCMTMSTLIFIIRLGFNIQNIYKQVLAYKEKKKQNQEILLGNINLQNLNYSVSVQQKLETIFQKSFENTKAKSGGYDIDFPQSFEIEKRKQ